MSFFDIDFTGSKLMDRITRDEVISVIENTSHKIHPGTDGSVFVVGFSKEKRIIIIEYNYKTKKHIKIKLSKLPPHEIYIEDFYCECEKKGSPQ
jgi:hypothetical protein